MFELLCATFELQILDHTTRTNSSVQDKIRLFLIGPNNNNRLLRMAILARRNPGVVDFGATITIFSPKNKIVVTIGSKV